MNQTWLIIDVHNLAHRALHTMGSLQFDGKGTGIIFGILRDVLYLQELHAATHVAFAFDSRHSLRAEQHPFYKSNRRDKEYTDEEQEQRAELHSQLIRLRKEYLPTIGYRNIFVQKGYEADDLIASICHSTTMMNPRPDIVIVSSDQDLYQLLRDYRITIWNPHRKKPFTEKEFYKLYGIDPLQWPYVKAMAGCTSDGITGIKGIGEATAAKFLRGKLKEESKAYAAIEAGVKIWKRNLPLVKLPYPGLRSMELHDDEVTSDGWKKVADMLGMKTLAIGRGLIGEGFGF